jgi:hypothetical protein
VIKKKSEDNKSIDNDFEPEKPKSAEVQIGNLQSNRSGAVLKSNR